MATTTSRGRRGRDPTARPARPATISWPDARSGSVRRPRCSGPAAGTCQRHRLARKLRVGPAHEFRLQAIARRKPETVEQIGDVGAGHAPRPLRHEPHGSADGHPAIVALARPDGLVSDTPRQETDELHRLVVHRHERPHALDVGVELAHRLGHVDRSAHAADHGLLGEIAVLLRDGERAIVGLVGSLRPTGCRCAPRR